ncbi:hypothetical protein BDW75DRAFT_246932 [Aspergillus navahoensis]
MSRRAIRARVTSGLTCRRNSSVAAAQSFTIDGDRHKPCLTPRRNGNHFPAHLSASSPGGVTRPFLQLGAEYKVNALESRFAQFGGADHSAGKFDAPLGALKSSASFEEQGIKAHDSLALMNWTNEEGACFFLPLYPLTAHASLSDDGSRITVGSETARQYVPNVRTTGCLDWRNEANHAAGELACSENGNTTGGRGLNNMSSDIVRSIEGIASLHGLKDELTRPMLPLPRGFWLEAVDCVHDSTMTRLKRPTAMVFMRGRDGIRHCAKE